MSMRHGIGWIYAIQAADGGPVKIGKTADPARRLAEFQAACPIPLRIVGAWEYDHPHMIESLAHQTFAEARLHGEWFDASSPDVAAWLASGMAPGDWLSGRLRLRDADREEYRRSVVQEGLALCRARLGAS